MLTKRFILSALQKKIPRVTATITKKHFTGSNSQVYLRTGVRYIRTLISA